MPAVRRSKAEVEQALEGYAGMRTRAELTTARETIQAKRDILAREGTTREVDARLQGVIAGLDLALGALPLAYFT